MKDVYFARGMNAPLQVAAGDVVKLPAQLFAQLRRLDPSSTHLLNVTPKPLVKALGFLREEVPRTSMRVWTCPVCLPNYRSGPQYEVCPTCDGTRRILDFAAPRAGRANSPFRHNLPAA